MAVSSEQIVDFLVSNPGMSDAQIVSAMETYGISPAQMAQAVGVPEGQVAARVAEVIPPNQAVLLGDTYVQAQNQVIGSGTDQQVGGLQNVVTYKAVDNKVGGDVKFYSPTGEFQQTTKQQEVNATKDFIKFLAGSAALFGGAALAGGGAETAFAGEALADANLLAGGGTTLGGTTFAGEALADAGLLSGGSTTTLGGATFAGEALADAGLLSGGGGSLTGGATTTLGGGATTTLGGATTLEGATALDGAATLGGASTLGGAATNLGATGLGATLGGVAGATLGGLTAAQIAALGLSGAGVLQTETARKAAVKAQEMIDAETAAAKQAAQFRPVGMTTRFGSSQFVVDPKTGQLTSAGYTLSPEAKAAQDRFVKLAESGIQQAEGAQKAFEPLQTGAQSLFKLGAGYLAEKPETVAENYLKSQMALLQPGRELELANLQTKLRNQGRIGLSVAQGGNLGATTPELQALYNARAQQEAQLAANAQQYGQQNVLFGAGLLGQGATAMGQYYGGQQQAYSPYTTAMGQVTGLETAGQQPFQMGVDLGKIGAQTGFDIGRLGLQGAGQSVALATSPEATTNPYATLLTGLFS